MKSRLEHFPSSFLRSKVASTGILMAVTEDSWLLYFRHTPSDYLVSTVFVQEWFLPIIGVNFCKEEFLVLFFPPRGVQWAVPPGLARGPTHYIVVPRLRKWPIVPPCRPVSPSCQPIVLAHSASLSCQPIVPAHHASPSCQPIVPAHRASPSSLLKNYLNLVTCSLSNI